MHVVITKESTKVVSSISPFEPKLVLMFLHIDSIKEFIKVKKITNCKWRGRI
jgi:hypothetical protein